jgi:CP family cyanate transporter-like MFS transporter
MDNMVNDHYRIPWKIIVIAIFLNFTTWAFLFIIPPMETILSASLRISHFQTSLLFTAPIIMLAIVAIPAGIIADRIGLKRAIGFGAVIASIAALLRGIESTYSGLLILSLIFGFGMGFTFSNLPKLARSCSSTRQTSLVMGFITAFGLLAGIGFALAITIPLIYPLTKDYHDVFYIWSIPLVIATILWWILVHEPPCPSNEVESDAKGSIGLKEVLRDKTLWSLAFILLLHNIYFYTWAAWIPTFLLQKGVSLGFSGLLASVMLWVGVPTIIFIPKLFSKTNISKRLLIWLPSLIFAFLSIWIIYATGFSLWIIMIIAGIINILRFNTLLSLPVEIMPKKHAGVAGGVVIAIGYLGAVIGPSMAGIILDVTGSFQIIFLILAVISIITMVLTFLIPTNNKKAENY